MQIIKDKTITEDNYTHFSGEGDFPAGDIIIPVKLWQERRQELGDRRVGVMLEPDQPPSEIRDDLDNFDLIAINFPAFKDGRGYSYAKILRDRYGFRKEIRAVGDVLRDQLFYMQRCGFNSYELKQGRDINDALKGLSDFSVKYQVSADEKIPLYRRK